MGKSVNPIQATLFPKADAAVLAAGNTVADLTVGQAGVFNADTGLSINAGGAGAVSRFFVAVGLDTSGDGNVDDIAKSSGQEVQKANVTGYESLCYREGVDQIVRVGDIDIVCGKDYIVKVGVRDAKAFSLYGYNPVYKSFVVPAQCCDNCEDCASGDNAEFAFSLRDRVNADPEGLFSAIVVSSNAPTVEITDREHDFTSNSPEVVITVNHDVVKKYCGIPFTYTFPRGTAFDVSFPDWDCAIPSVTEVQALGFELVSGVDAQMNEFVAQGITNSPYRITESGVQNVPAYLSNASGRYNVINLTYDVEAWGADRLYHNSANTNIYLACEDNTAGIGIATILDALLPTFAAQAAAITACDGCDEEAPSGPSGGSGE